MVKKKKIIKKFHINTLLIIVLLIIISVVFFGITQDRYTVFKNKFETQNQIISSSTSYKTEYCANKLTELNHEIYFLEQEIKSEENILGNDANIKDAKQKVVRIEKQELSDIKKEFDTYKTKCDSFDLQISKKLCDEFIQDSKSNLEFSQKNAEQTSGLEYIELNLKNVRKAKRIYTNLNKICEKIQ